MTFKKHYTLDEARAMLPQVRLWLAELDELRANFTTLEARLIQLRQDGCDLGGPTVNDMLRNVARLQEVLSRFADAGIEVKDLDRGLVDFPAIRDGKEVFLCWEKCEDDIAFWHDLDAGYAGREPI